MSRILILCESAGGPVSMLAAAIADGARGAGAEVQVRPIADRASALDPADPGEALHCHAGAAAVDALAGYDAIVFGVGSSAAGWAERFLDRVAARRPLGALNGKVGSAFTAAAPGAGTERTLTEIHARLMRLGLVCVGRPDGESGRLGREEAATAARTPGPDALAAARAQGRHVADIAGRLFPAAAMLGESEQTEHFLLGR